MAGGPTGDGYVYDTGTGATLRTYNFADMPPGTFVNDVVATRTAAYFTESMRPVLYRVPLGPEARQALVRHGDAVRGLRPQAGFNVNGIDATPNGKTLVIVQSNTGKLFTVDPDTGVATEIDLGGATVVGGDGLLLDGPTLYVVVRNANLTGIAAVRSRRT